MLSRAAVANVINRLKKGAALLAALLVTLWTVAAIAEYRLPKHRGPLTPGEMKAAVTGARARGPGRNLRAAARRYLQAQQEGRDYRPRKYDVIHNDEFYGGTLIVPKGTPKDKPYSGNYALIGRSNKIHVQLNLKRRESGKPGATTLGIRFNPGEGIHRRYGPHSMHIMETRNSSNGNTPGDRLTMRSYNGANWDVTSVHESDGNLNRGGVRLPGSQIADTWYQPGNRMGVWNSPKSTFKTTKNHNPIQ